MMGMVLAGCGGPSFAVDGLPLAPDREERIENGPLSPATQSVNRHRSVLQRLDSVGLKLAGGRLQLGFHDPRGSGRLSFENIDARFLAPLLPYAHDRKLSAFDRVNLMLAEYSRNGVELPYQERNSSYGHFTAENLFDDSDEYEFVAGKIVPNPAARPKRMSLVNNCLSPGLWEVSASDSVGEMYHAWWTLPERVYFTLVRAVGGFDASDAELHDTLAYRAELEPVPLDLDRLRARTRALGTAPVSYNLAKPVASYSSQDSRRKVQRRFLKVVRDGREIQPTRFADLQPGDLFRFYSFVPPGIYTKRVGRDVRYDPIWTSAALAEVKPKTRWHGGAAGYKYTLGAVELTLRSDSTGRALVIGNLPVDLLVFQEDFDIPGFGVGVQRPSEAVEKRYFFFQHGPDPVYAYLAVARDGKLIAVNNHEHGLEQIYLRPVRRGDDVFLRVTLVAYERIVDILELELLLPAELAGRVRQASELYQRPLWRSFSDSNLL